MHCTCCNRKTNSLHAILSAIPALDGREVCGACARALALLQEVGFFLGFYEVPTPELIGAVVDELRALWKRLVLEETLLLEARHHSEQLVRFNAVARLRQRYDEILADLNTSFGPHVAADVRQLAEGRRAAGYLPAETLQLGLF